MMHVLTCRFAYTRRENSYKLQPIGQTCDMITQPPVLERNKIKHNEISTSMNQNLQIDSHVSPLKSGIGFLHFKPYVHCQKIMYHNCNNL